MQNNLEIGERIRGIRENLHMSREKFSEMIDKCLNDITFEEPINLIDVAQPTNKNKGWNCCKNTD